MLLRSQGFTDKAEPRIWHIRRGGKCQNGAPVAAVCSKPGTGLSPLASHSILLITARINTPGTELQQTATAPSPWIRQVFTRLKLAQMERKKLFRGGTAWRGCGIARRKWWRGWMERALPSKELLQWGVTQALVTWGFFNSNRKIKGKIRLLKRMVKINIFCSTDGWAQVSHLGFKAAFKTLLRINELHTTCPTRKCCHPLQVLLIVVSNGVPPFKNQN